MLKKDLVARYYVISVQDDRAEVLGYVRGVDRAYRCALVLGGRPCFFASDLYESFTAEQFISLHEQVMEEPFKPKMVTREHANPVWAKMNEQPYTHLRKVSVSRILAHIYQRVGAGYTREELIELCPGSKWITVKTALSDVRSSPTNIRVRKVEGLYVRQESSP